MSNRVECDPIPKNYSLSSTILRSHSAVIRIVLITLEQQFRGEQLGYTIPTEFRFLLPTKQTHLISRN